MRTFKLLRDKDHSGVSGTGEVAEGVEFEDGQVVICWLSKFHSVGVFDNIKCLEKIHGHDGDTKVVWVGPILEKCKECNGCGRTVHYDYTINTFSHGPLISDSKCYKCDGTGKVNASV